MFPGTHCGGLDFGYVDHGFERQIPPIKVSLFLRIQIVIATGLK